MTVTRDDWDYLKELTAKLRGRMEAEKAEAEQLEAKLYPEQPLAKVLPFRPGPMGGAA